MRKKSTPIHHRNAVKVRCSRGGHPLSGENLYTRMRDGRPRRECIACRREQAKTRYWKAKAKGIKVPDFHTKESKKRAYERYLVTGREQKRNYSREYKRRHPEKERNRRLRKAHGITLIEYNSMLVSQGGLCAICKKGAGEWNKPHLVVDHCHETGIIRGLLCHACNTAIGHMRDNPEILRSGANYLENHIRRQIKNRSISEMPKVQVS